MVNKHKSTTFLDVTTSYQSNSNNNWKKTPVVDAITWLHADSTRIYYLGGLCSWYHQADVDTQQSASTVQLVCSPPWPAAAFHCCRSQNDLRPVMNNEMMNEM